MTPREAYVNYVKKAGENTLNNFEACAPGSSVLTNAINKFNKLMINTQTSEQSAEM